MVSWFDFVLGQVLSFWMSMDCNVRTLQEKTISSRVETYRCMYNRRSLAAFLLSTRNVTIVLRADQQNYRRTILSLGDVFCARCNE